MKFLIYGEEAMWTSIAFRLQELEGQDVRIYCSKEEGKEHLAGIVKHIDTLSSALAWVGRNGYILSEDENDISRLRNAGYRVYGGNKWTEKMENDRPFQMQVIKKAGIAVPNFHEIKTIEEGIAFIKKNPDVVLSETDGPRPEGMELCRQGR